MQLYQQVERLMLQNHYAGDVVGEGDPRPSWSVTVRSAKARPVNRLALSSVRPSSKGCFDMVWPEWRENSLCIKLYNEAGRNGRSRLPSSRSGHFVPHFFILHAGFYLPRHPLQRREMLLRRLLNGHCAGDIDQFRQPITRC